MPHSTAWGSHGQGLSPARGTDPDMSAAADEAHFEPPLLTRHLRPFAFGSWRTELVYGFHIQSSTVTPLEWSVHV